MSAEDGEMGEPGNGDESAPADRSAPEPAAPKRKPPRPLREPVYQALWQSYRDGIREKEPLQKLHALGRRTVTHAIEFGWPEANMPSLKSRAELWDKQRDQERQRATAEADRKAAEDKGRLDAITWSQFQPQGIAIALKGLSVLKSFADTIAKYQPGATFIRYRRVAKLVNGKREVIDEPYVDALSVAQAVRMWSLAFKETGNVVAFLTGKSDGTEGRPRRNLTPEDVEAFKIGRVPEGWTMDEAIEAAVAALKDTGTDNE